jgi:hypothetical protein
MRRIRRRQECGLLAIGKAGLKRGCSNSPKIIPYREETERAVAADFTITELNQRGADMMP